MQFVYLLYNFEKIISSGTSDYAVAVILCAIINEYDRQILFTKLNFGIGTKG